MTKPRLSKSEKVVLRLALTLGSLLILDGDKAAATKLCAKGLATLIPVGTMEKITLTNSGRALAEITKIPKETNPVPERPCLVNILTGEKSYGNPGEDPEHLFERLFS